jgi:hypothetical protein
MDQKPKKKAKQTEGLDDTSPRHSKRSAQDYGGNRKGSNGLLIGLLAGGGVLLLLVCCGGAGIGSFFYLKRGALEPGPGAGADKLAKNNTGILVPSFVENPQIADDPKWKKGPEAERLIAGRWRNPAGMAYLFNMDGTYQKVGLEDAKGRYRFSGQHDIELVYRLDFPPKSNETTRKSVLLISDDELAVLTRTDFGGAGPKDHVIDGIFYKMRDDGTGPGRAKVIDPQIASLRFIDKNVRMQALLKLTKFGPDAWPAVPELIKALRDSDADIQTRALLCLADIGPKAMDAVPSLINILRGPRTPHVSTAIYTLGRIGPDARPAIPDLIRYTKDGSLGPAARAALDRIDPSWKK